MARFLRNLPIFIFLLSATGTRAQQPLDCTLPHQPNIDISVRTAWASPRWKNLALNIPITANLNPQTDSIPEILLTFDNLSSIMKMVIFRGDGQNAAQPDTMLLPGGLDFVSTPAVGDIDGDGIPEVIYTAWDRYIRVLRHYTPGANPPMSLWLTADAKTRTGGFRPTLADLDGDGTPEIVAGDEVFIFDFSNPAAPLLRKVLDANGKNGESVTSFTPRRNAVAAVDILGPADCGGDPDCNGLEIVAGPVIYSVDLDTTDGDGFQIKVQRNLNTPSQPNQYSDGYTAVADLNLDGTPDIAVSGILDQGTPFQKFGVYVWNKNGLIKFMPRPDSLTDFSAYFDNNFPTIANVFDDRKLGQAKDYPEIISSGNQFLICQNLHAFAYPDYSAWWFLPSGNTLSWGGSATAFDFNADGYAELAYGDEQNLRILYGGAVPFPAGVDAERNWATVPGGVGSNDTYPVIADVDNDGETDIAATVRDQSILSQDSSGIRLILLKSAGLPWPPSRPVWNQHTYNVVNVNDDLSIPAVPKKQWLELPAAGSGNRPFNMFLGQVPLLGPNGQPVIPLPDASASVDSAGCNQNQLLLHLQICNPGDAKLPAGSTVQFYLGNPTTTAAPKFGAPQPIPVPVPAGQCIQWTASLPMPPDGILWGVVNDNGSKAAPFNLATTFPSTGQIECNYANNLFSATIAFAAPALDLGPDRMACNNTASTLHAGPGFAQYQWADGTADSTFTAPGPGKYWVAAWDRCGNLYSDTLNIAAIATPSIDLGADRAVCAGAALTLNLPGFDQLNWTTSAGSICADCPSVTLQPTGATTIWVAGQSNGCTLRDTLQVDAAPVPQLTGQATATTCGLSNGAINLQISQGTAPFQTQWTGGLVGTQAGNLPAGQYAVTVTDALGCGASATFLVAPSASPAFAAPVLTPVRCFGENNGAAGIPVSGGQPPYQFNWSTGPGGNTLTNLAAGQYAVTATDAAGCTTTAQFSIPEPPALNLQATVDSTSCTSTTGSISVTAQGGTPGYAYAWSSGQTASALSNLPPGIYTVTLSDANGCTALQNFQLTPGGSPGLASPVLTPARCFGEANGKIEVSASGDAAPFQFTWSTGPGGNSLNNLGAGNYGLTVTGANGCTATAQFSIPEPPLLSLQAIVDSTSCSSTTGGISLTAQGGTPSYAYAWSSGQTAPALSNLPPGAYTVTLSDANGCTALQNFQLTPGGSPGLASPVLTPVRCFGEANGKIAVNVSGDAAPFSYTWSTGPGGNSLNNLGAGNYGLTVTGANGCTAAAQFSIPEPPLLSLQAIVDSTSCTSTTGSISVTAQGGTPGYAYAWGGGQTTPVLSNLPPGNYTVTLSDANGCTALRSFQLTPGGSPGLASPVLTPVRCFGEANGKIEVSASGDAAPFSYTWSTGPGGNSLNNLGAGNYGLTVTGANGCTATAQFSIPEPPLLSLQAIVDSTSCSSTTGGISLTAQGGTPDYAYAWSGGQTTPVLSNLPPGAYTVTLSDANGCTALRSFQLTPGGSPGLASPMLTPVRCFGEANGKIEVSASGGVAPYQFNWSTGPGNAVLPNLKAGAYALTVSDTKGCSSTAQFVLDEPAALSLSLQATPIACAGSTGSLAASAQGGTGAYAYAWENGSTTPQRGGLPAGTYTLTATDANGCAVTENVVLAEPAPLSQTAIVDSVSCQAAGNIAVAPQGGTPPYAFAWSNGPSGALNSGLAAGSYTVTTTDANGCSHMESFTLTAGDMPAIVDALLTPVRCFGENNGQIQLNVGNGQAPYQFLWSNNGSANPLGGLVAGTYTVTVTDAKNCVLSAQFSIGQPALLQTGIQSISADTCGRHTGSIDLNVSGGAGPYQFAWSNGYTGEDLVQVAAGNWALTLTDAHGCTTLQTAAVPAADPVPAFALSGGTITCATPAVNIAVSPVAADWTILWQTPGGGVLSGATQQVSTPGNYPVTVTNAAGCSAVQQVVVPANTTVPQALVAADSVFIPCGQPTALLDGSASGGGPQIEAHWYRLDNGQWTGDTLAYAIATGEAGFYLLKVLDLDNGCAGYDTVEVVRAPGIDAVLWGADSISCFGLNDGSIRVEQVLGGTPPYRYSIDAQTFVDAPFFEHLPPGPYTLAVEDAAGCRWQTALALTKPDSFGVALHASDTLLNPGQVLRLKADIAPPGKAIASIEWSPAELFGPPQQLEQWLAPEVSTLFGVRVTDDRGCTAETAISVQVARIGLYLPSAIRPGGLPGNDVFTVYAGADVRRVRLLRLFDRWGELLFERRDFPPNDPALGWDGRYRGQPAAPGVYVYHLIVELADGSEVTLTGDVTLL